jgi:hypothetical protein
MRSFERTLCSTVPKRREPEVPTSRGEIGRGEASSETNDGMGVSFEAAPDSQSRLAGRPQVDALFLVSSGHRFVGFHSAESSLVLLSVSSIASSFRQLRRNTMLFIK